MTGFADMMPPAHDGGRESGFRELPFRQAKPVLDRRAGGSVLIWQDHPMVAAERTIVDIFVARAHALPYRVFLAEPDAETGWKTITYGAMLGRARRIAAGLLQSRGIRPGERLLILSGESIDHAAVTLGAMMAGIVVAPISVGYSKVPDGARYRHVLGLIRPAMVFADDEAAFGPALAASGAAVLVAGDGPNGLAELEGSTAPVAVDAALAAIDSDTVFKILLTSGSTAMPKGVIQTHRMACASLAFEASLSTLPPGPREAHVVLDWLPWSHVGGSMTSFNNVLLSGASLYLDDGRPVPGRFEPTIRHFMEFPPEVFASPPAGCAMLVDAMDRDPALRSRFFSRLLYVKSGAAAMPEEIRRRFQEHSMFETGHLTPMLMGYGTTETHGVVSVNQDARLASLLGLPKPGVVIKLVPIGANYEIRIKSASVTPGYFGDDAATAAAFDEEGFFQTGDSATIDLDNPREGLIFTGRIGENFKMATGTWVAGAELRAAVMAALEGDAEECVMLGEGQVTIGLLLWAKDDDPRRLERIGAALRGFNAAATGESRRIGRIVLSRTPISADLFERTEKGSLNRSLILANRKDEVDMLYAEQPPAGAVIDLSLAERN